MTSFENYHLAELPRHLHFPRECEPFVARRLRGDVGTPASSWPAHVDADHCLMGLEWHRIGPVLYRHCEKSGELDALPTWLREYLKNVYRRSTAVNLAASAELTVLLTELRQAAVPVILLKGAALMRTVYEHIGLRPMVDVDILIRDADLGRARDILRRSGYQTKESRKPIERDHHLQFVRRGGNGTGVFLELHWRLSDQDGLSDRMPAEDLWNRAQAAPAPWSTALVFDGADQVLHAALHIAEHCGYPQLRWLCDQHEMSLRLNDDDWRELASRAVRYELHLVLAACLQETTRWFGTVVPHAFWSELERGLPASPAAVHAFSRCHPPALLEHKVQELRSIRTLRGKLAHGLELLFPDARVVRRRHMVPRDSAVWPYYLLRLGNGLRAGIKNGFQLLANGAARRQDANKSNGTTAASLARSTANL